MTDTSLPLLYLTHVGWWNWPLDKFCFHEWWSSRTLNARDITKIRALMNRLAYAFHDSYRALSFLPQPGLYPKASAPSHHKPLVTIKHRLVWAGPLPHSHWQPNKLHISPCRLLAVAAKSWSSRQTKKNNSVSLSLPGRSFPTVTAFLTKCSSQTKWYSKQAVTPND